MSQVTVSNSKFFRRCNKNTRIPAGFFFVEYSLKNLLFRSKIVSLYSNKSQFVMGSIPTSITTFWSDIFCEFIHKFDPSIDFILLGWNLISYGFNFFWSFMIVTAVSTWRFYLIGLKLTTFTQRYAHKHKIINLVKETSKMMKSYLGDINENSSILTLNSIYLIIDSSVY